MRRVLALGALMALAGCATSFQVLDAKLPSFVGQPITSAINRLGPPNYVQKINGQKYYTWESQSYGSSEFGIYKLICEISLTADLNDVVLKTSYDGNNGECEKYSRRLG